MSDPAKIQFPKERAERTFNVQHYERRSRGGHFAPLEEPELSAGKLQDFFADYG